MTRKFKFHTSLWGETAVVIYFQPFSHVCVCLEVRLTKNLRRGLVFLDHHMSSSRRNKKHLKVTFVTAAAGEAEAGEG